MNPPAETPVQQTVQLLLQYPEGRSERIPLEPGIWKVGSSPWSCDIVLEAPGVAPLHGLLEVRDGLVSFEDHSVPIIADDAAPRAQVVLEAGDSLTIAGVRLTVGGHYVWPSPQRLDSPSGTAQVRGVGEVGLSLGTVGYPRFQRMLADEISPGESAEARQRFRGSLWTFTYLLLGWLALVAVRWFLPAAGDIPRLHADLCSAAAMIVALVAASYGGIPFAGQLVLPLAAVFWIAGIPEVDWTTTNIVLVVKLLTILPYHWLLGWALDCGASTEPGRSRPGVRPWLLVAVGIAWVVGHLAGARETEQTATAYTEASRWIAIASGIVVGLWGWISLPRLEEGRGIPALDVQSVLDGAYVRWGRLVQGQMLAIAAGLMPLVMFLSSLGMTERLAWPEHLPDAAHDPPVISHRSQGTPVAWFWETRGHYLRQSDLALDDAKIYVFPADAFESAANVWIDMALETLQKKQTGLDAQSAFAELERQLAPHRATEAKSLAAALEKERGWVETAKVRSWRVLHLELQTSLATGSEGKPQVVYHAAPLKIKPIEPDHPALTTIGMVVNYFYLSFAVIGFAMLWRRGGESPLARWLGLLFAGFACVLFSVPSQSMVESMRYELWSESLHFGSLSSLKITALILVQVVAGVLVVAGCFGIPFAVVWVELCWPSSQPEEERGLVDWLSGVGKTIVVLMGFFVLTVVIFMVAMFIYLFAILAAGEKKPSEWMMLPLMGIGATGTLLVFTIYGLHLRKTTAIHSEVPNLTWKPLTMIGSALAAVVLLLTWQWTEFGAPWQANLCVGAGLVMVAVFIGSALAAMLVDNFLRLSEARDISAILATAVLPFALETSDNLIDLIFRDFHLLLHSVHGSTVLSILLVVLVMVPLHGWLERNLKKWSLGPLASLADEIAHLLQEFPALAESARRARVDAFFERWNIPTYAFYARAEGIRFAPVVGHHDGQLPDMQLSAELLDFLQDRPHFCDLEHIPYEWSYYFQQFELYRLQQATGGRYLLPLVLGPTVRGLLLLPDCPGGETLARDAIADELAPLGVEVVCGSGEARSLKPEPPLEPELVSPAIAIEEAPVEVVPVDET